MKTVRVRLWQPSSIPGARWCDPVGWEPKNQIEGTEFMEGSWWDGFNETARLVWFGNVDSHEPEEEVEVNPEDLRVASCVNCRVIGKVQL